MSSVDDETILEVLRNADDPRLTTTEVAGKLPVTRGTTRTRLQALADEGLLTRTRKGRNVVWWLPERADEFEAASGTEDAAASSADESAEGDGGDGADELDTTEVTDEDEPATEASADAATDEVAAAATAGSDETADAEPDSEEVDETTTVDEWEAAGEADTDIEVRVPEDDADAPAARVEPLHDASTDDARVRAVLALLALAVLYALIRRLRR